MAQNKKNALSDHRGSTLIWAMFLMIMVLIFLGFLAPLAASTINKSRSQNDKSQAYYTARSVAKMIGEYVVKDPYHSPGSTIVEKAKSADSETGTDWNVSGLDTDMGKCDVNLRFKNDILFVKATATVDGETRTVTAKLQQTVTGAEITTADEYLDGYLGVRAKKIEDTTTDAGNSIIMDSGPLLLTGGETGENSSISLLRGEKSIGIGDDKKNLIFANSPIVENNKVQSDNLSSIVSTADIRFTNKDNIMNFKSNYKATSASKNSGSRYPLYTTKKMELVGQNQILGPTGNNINVSAKEIDLSGRSVDPGNEIAPNAGFSSVGIRYYTEDKMDIDFADLRSRDDDKGDGLITSDGLVSITNLQGATKLYGLNEENTNIDLAAVTCKGFSIKASNVENHDIEIDGNVYVGKDQTKIDAAKNDSDVKVQDTADNYAGNATIVADGDSQVTIKGNIVANGDISIKGNGNKSIKIEGNVISNGTISMDGNIDILGYVQAKKVQVEVYNSNLVWNKKCVLTVGNNIYALESAEINYESILTPDKKYNTKVILRNANTLIFNQEYFSQKAENTWTSDDKAKLTQTNLSSKMNWGKCCNDSVSLYDTDVKNAINNAQTSSPRDVDNNIPSIKEQTDANPVKDINGLSLNSDYLAYEYTKSCNLGTVNINGYGDVYIIVGKDATVSVDAIKSTVFSGNLYFLVRPGGKLKLNATNVLDTKFTASIFTQDTGTVEIGDNTTIEGILDVDTLRLGKNITFIRGTKNQLSGGVSSGSTHWAITQYIDKAS